MHADWLVWGLIASTIHLREAGETKSRIEVHFQPFFRILKETN